MKTCVKIIIFAMLFAYATAEAGAQQWVSTKVVGPFVCWGNFDLKEVEPQLASLAEVHQELNVRLKLPTIQQWIEVYIFDSDQTWRTFLKRHHPTIPYRRALFIKRVGQRCQLFVCRTGQFGVDIRHEGTHALIDSAVEGVPEWLHEGLAEYFEVLPANRQTGSDWFEATKRNAKMGTSRKLPSLERLQNGMAMTNTDYRDAWAWVNFLMNGPPEVRGVLAETFADYARGVQGPSVSKRVNSKMRNPDAALRAFYRGLE